MTLYGDLADSVKWKLCEFVSARPAGGDSNVEYDFALEIIQMVKGQIAREILAKCENKTETNTSEFGSCEVVGCLEFIQLEDTAYYEVTCTHAEDAAIAGGKW